MNYNRKDNKKQNQIIDIETEVDVTDSNQQEIKLRHQETNKTRRKHKQGHRKCTLT